VQFSPLSCMYPQIPNDPEKEWLIASLHIHRRNVKLDPDRRSLLRSLEVGSAVSLFILWPRKSPLHSPHKESSHPEWSKS
jgi:hypothetical protein